MEKKGVVEYEVKTLGGWFENSQKAIIQVFVNINCFKMSLILL